MPFREEIRVEHLSFRFEDDPKEQEVLHDLSLTIRKGEHVGIQGASGAGKTTLFNLLLGFYRPTSGQITIDGVPLTGKNCRMWQNAVGYVSQHVFLTDGTLLQNVALGEEPEQIDRERVRKALRAARLDQFVASLSTRDGYPDRRGREPALGRAAAAHRDRPRPLQAGPISSSSTRPPRHSTTVPRRGSTGPSPSSHAENRNLTIVIIAHRDSSLEYCDRIINLESPWNKNLS